MRSLLYAGALACAVVAAIPAQATPFHLKTFMNVPIGTQRFDVLFTDSAFSALSATQRVPVFVTLADATAALNAIISYAGSPSYNDLVSQAIVPNNPYRSVVVPFTASFARNPSAGDFLSVYRGAGINDLPSMANGYQLEADVNYNFFVPETNPTVFPGGLTIATFSASVPAEVPEPASIALLALGVLGAGLGRRLR